MSASKFEFSNTLRDARHSCFEPPPSIHVGVAQKALIEASRVSTSTWPSFNLFSTLLNITSETSTLGYHHLKHSYLTKNTIMSSSVTNLDNSHRYCYISCLSKDRGFFQFYEVCIFYFNINNLLAALSTCSLLYRKCLPIHPSYRLCCWHEAMTVNATVTSSRCYCYCYYHCCYHWHHHSAALLPVWLQSLSMQLLLRLGLMLLLLLLLLMLILMLMIMSLLLLMLA
ncbi:hypothetical protein C8R42DRAFT_39423 [Lentinula raphanica]|nr:hypothetical protein C8R42DRAFT_39423 [Lentinula raphanica]